MPGGPGSVDVLLSKGETTVACEITVTTSIEHEIRNLEKCAAGGFTHIVSVSAEVKRAREIEQVALREIEAPAFSRIRFLTPEGLFAFVLEMDASLAGPASVLLPYPTIPRFGALSSG